MSSVERLLEEAAETGQLERQLRGQFSRWSHLWSYSEFRDTVLSHAWEHRGQFLGESVAEYLGWLRQVGWSVAVDRARTQGRWDRLRRRLAALLPTGEPEPTERLDTQDLVNWLIAGLTDRERQLLVLKYYHDKSTAELAAELGTSPAAVHQLHHRAITKLRERLKEEKEDPGP